MCCEARGARIGAAGGLGVVLGVDEHDGADDAAAEDVQQDDAGFGEGS
jgi:hypothetical protein